MSTRHAILCACVLVALSRPAHAETGFDLLNQGVQLRRDGKDEQALDAFRRAYVEWPSPRVLAQIGLAEQALGRWTDAHRDLTTALESNQDSWIQKNGAVLREGLRATDAHLASFAVEAAAPGAELFLGGVRVSALPMKPVYREPGAIDVEVRAPGRLPAATHVVLEAGRSSYVRVALESPQAEPKRQVYVERPASPDAPPTGSSLQRTAAWMTATAGVVFLAGGVLGHVERERLAAKYNDAPCAPGVLSREERCGAYRNDANLFQTLAVVGYASAGAAAVAATLLFVTDKGAPTKTVGVLVAPSGAYVRGSF
jgi:tetratricopeptide (TPR) repeat protein